MQHLKKGILEITLQKKNSIESNQKNEDKVQKKVKALRDNLRKRKKQVRVNKSDLKTVNN